MKTHYELLERSQLDRSYSGGFAAALQEAADLARQGLPGEQGDKKLARAILALDQEDTGK